jgi:hypothetical protein
MRKFLMVMGAIALVLFAVVGVGIFMTVRGGADIEAESKPYAEESVAAIATKWNQQEFLRRALPAVRESTKSDELKRLMEAFAAGLGPLVEYEAKMANFTVMTATQGKIVTVNYLVNARFEKGPATIRLTVVKSDGTWMIHTFFVDSPALINNLMGRPS